MDRSILCTWLNLSLEKNFGQARPMYWGNYDYVGERTSTIYEHGEAEAGLCKVDRQRLGCARWTGRGGAVQGGQAEAPRCLEERSSGRSYAVRNERPSIAPHTATPTSAAPLSSTFLTELVQIFCAIMGKCEARS
jgi:hypothetical protein